MSVQISIFQNAQPLTLDMVVHPNNTKSQHKVSIGPRPRSGSSLKNKSKNPQTI